MNELRLASASPRRKQLLELLSIPFDIVTAYVDETFHASLTPEQIVQKLALRKATTVAQKSTNKIVIGADTIVVFNDEILGKPVDEAEAVAMLSKLSGASHHVYTCVAIVKNEQQMTFYEKTTVQFWELTVADINNYVATGQPFDKAGGYGIQGHGALLVKKISGDYYNVVGLPVGRLYRELTNFLTK